LDPPALSPIVTSMKLLNEIKNCSLCRFDLPLEPRPILQFHSSAQLLLMGQAPGLKAHETNKPWNDASGVRLRGWLGLESKTFYNPKKTAIVPMGFCYPGRGKSGDLPPRKECTTRWMDTILCELTQLQMIILVGSYAASYFFSDGNLTQHIREQAESSSSFIVLPHPSPRNNIWLSKNEWFEANSLPKIRRKLEKLSSS
jgi:uracil-DNA glycosylase